MVDLWVKQINVKQLLLYNKSSVSPQCALLLSIMLVKGLNGMSSFESCHVFYVVIG